MPTDRRSFVKMLGYGALYGALSCAVEETFTDSLMAECSSSSFVCILLHGLFFMGFKGNNLIVATPTFTPHQFQFREQGNALGSLPGGQNIDWTSVGLVDNTASTMNFLPNIPQFSSGETGVGEFMPAGTTSHKFQLILPRPDEIHGFRECDISKFKDCTEKNHPKPSGLTPMRENIISKCGPNFALLTGLVFRKTAAWKRKSVVSFYAEHRNSCDLTKDDLNLALNEGKTLFKTPGNFDLQYSKPPAPTSTCPNECDGFGVTKDDQLSIEEISLQDCCVPKGANPINCAQYAVNN